MSKKLEVTIMPAVDEQELKVEGEKLQWLVGKWDEGEPMPEPKMMINDRIVCFYLLEELQSAVDERKGEMGYNPAFISFAEDLKEFRDKHNNELTSVFQDYLTIACISEARHGEVIGRCKQPFALFLGKRKILRSSMERNACTRTLIADSEQIDPRLSLCTMLTLFKGRPWHNHFGGEKWARIVETALMQYDTPREVFLDTVINLQHNTGSCLTKPNPFFYLISSRLQSFLDWRSSTHFSFFKFDTAIKGRLSNIYQTNASQFFERVHSIRMHCMSKIPFEVNRLLHRAVSLELVAQNADDFFPWIITKDFGDVGAYVPLKWGKRIITYKDC